MTATTHREATLRGAAESLLKTRGQFTKQVALQDTDRIVHELQVHQIELELQNEELSKTHSEVAALRDKYLDLYDFAPVGYFTVTPMGEVTELNLSAAELLGENRVALIGRRLQDFVSPDSLVAFAEFLASSGATSLTLTLTPTGGESIYVKAQGKRFNFTTDATEIRIVMMDITALRSANEELLRSFEKFFKYWRP